MPACRQSSVRFWPSLRNVDIQTVQGSESRQMAREQKNYQLPLARQQIAGKITWMSDLTAANSVLNAATYYGHLRKRISSYMNCSRDQGAHQNYYAQFSAYRSLSIFGILISDQMPKHCYPRYIACTIFCGFGADLPFLGSLSHSLLS